MPADTATPRPPDAAGGIDPEPLPPDPERYDSPRAELARAKGLDKPYIPGGDDPEPERAVREERFYGRILLIMIVVIVSAGFVLGIVGSILGGGG
jgi:hypothetical protein